MKEVKIQDLIDLSKEKLNELRLPNDYIDFSHRRAFQTILLIQEQKITSWNYDEESGLNSSESL